MNCTQRKRFLVTPLGFIVRPFIQTLTKCGNHFSEIKKGQHYKTITAQICSNNNINRNNNHSYNSNINHSHNNSNNNLNFKRTVKTNFLFLNVQNNQTKTNGLGEAKDAAPLEPHTQNNEHNVTKQFSKSEKKSCDQQKQNETANNKTERVDTVLIKDTENIDEDIKKSLLTVFQYKELTNVQKIVYENIIKEKKENDLLIQAKTGSGKTIAYLMLVLNDMLQNKNLSVHTLILVPTRELANQIYNETKMLLTYKRNINVLTLIGGIKRRDDQINIRRVKPDIIIATIGRLLDHFECTYLFNTLFQNLRMLIIDEADQLLSFGYFDEINRIVTYLPSNRKNILLSATLSHNLDDIRKKMCRENYIFLNCIPDASKHTNEQLKQYVLFHKAIDTTIILYNVLVEHMRRNQRNYKIIVFFPTARATSFYAHFFKNQIKMSVYELHKKKEPSQRQIISNRFAMETVGILFTSDISSRGVDYPNVTLIVQVNCAISREQYIHRVGRTARKNQEGSSILLLNEADQLFFEQIKDLPIQKIQSDEYALKNSNISQYLSSWMSNTQLLYLAYSFYSSLLRFYKTKYIHLKLSDDDIIDVVNNVLLSTGLVEQPYISSKLALTLNMQNNAKLKIRKDLDEFTV